ncbi:MAG: hypothetical protein ACI4WS_00710 [Oscillospiraceae bacterium]
MSLKFRQIAAAGCALVCAVSMCGCADNGYIGTIDGKQIPTGIYLYNVQFSAYNEAKGKVEEVKGEAQGTAEVTVFTETIDGKPASAWIKDTALESLKRYVAIENLFTEYGLTLSAEDSESVNSYIQTLDDDLGIYAQYYGIEENSFGEHYENLGIGKSSLRSITENSYKEKYVFLKYYDTDGLTPVTDEEINSYATENYAAVKLLKLDLTDYQGIELKDEAEIQAVKDLAQSYADRFNSGEDWTDIQYDFDLRNAQLEAWSEADEAYAAETPSTAEAAATAEAEAPAEADAGAENASTAEASTAEAAPEEETPAADASKVVAATDDAAYNAFVQSAIDAATAEKKESADDCDQFVNKDSSTLDQHVTEYIWNAEADGKATIFTDTEDGNSVYVVVREDITTKDSWKESQHETLLYEIKSDAFEEVLKSTYENYDVQLDDYLVNTKYAPEKLRDIGK